MVFSLPKVDLNIGMRGHVRSHMHQTLLRVITGILILSTTVSCTTAYDPYVRPLQVVDPGIALLGVAIAGLIGIALADDTSDRYHCNNNIHRGNQWRRRYRQLLCNNNRF